MRKWVLMVAGLAALGATLAGWGTAAGQKAPARLGRFASCGELVDYAKRYAPTVIGSGEILSPPGVVAAPSAAPGGRAGAADVSPTNVQEEGVDEPDIVKADAGRIFAVAGGSLHAVATSGARPRLVGSLALPQGTTGHELLLRKDRLLVLSSSGGFLEPPVGRLGILPRLPTSTVLSEIDVQNPAAMRVVRTLTIDGSYLSARLVGSSARVVIASTPSFPPPDGTTPKPGAAEPTAGAIASSTVRSWLPSATLADRRTGRTSTSALVQCRHVLHPPIFSGLGMVSVLTIDLDQGLPPVDADAVMMGAGTVYASTDGLYVASQRWLPQPLDGRGRPVGITTEIHKFDTSRPRRTEYRASGSVPGYLLSRWSLSEFKGALRVASTMQPLWWGTPQQESESFVSVLADRAGKLVQVGQVGGLGRGERVFAVRFLGDLGYVVTFRQVDPLYTLALDDPARPRVLGALKIRGYSSYLHPLGGDLLLGVGQDATDEGRVTGAQVSLFDVADPRRPDRLDALALGSGSSEVEYDAHAFLYSPRQSLAVVPVQVSDPAKPFTGALVLRVSRKGVEQLGRISHPGGLVRRSVVVGSRLYTVSDAGVEADELGTLSRVAWLPFGS